MIEATGNDQPTNSSQHLCKRLENGISFTKNENENGLEIVLCWKFKEML